MQNGKQCMRNLVEVGDDIKLQFWWSIIFIKTPNAKSLFVSEGEDHWRQQYLISAAEIGLAAIKGLLTHTFIML